MLFPTPGSWSIKPLLLAAGLIVASGSSLAATELEGFVPEITTERLLFGGKHYALVQGASRDNAAKWPAATECHVKANPSYQVTCGTFAQIGYIDNAKLRIENGRVARVELLELMQ